jgi:hypothetical protein
VLGREASCAIGADPSDLQDGTGACRRTASGVPRQREDVDSGEAERKGRRCVRSPTDFGANWARPTGHTGARRRLAKVDYEAVRVREHTRSLASHEAARVARLAACVDVASVGGDGSCRTFAWPRSARGSSSGTWDRASRPWARRLGCAVSSD